MIRLKALGNYRHDPRNLVFRAGETFEVDDALGRFLLADAPGGGTTYMAIARHRSAETCKQHRDMGFFDGWGTVATQLDAYARTLMP